MMFFANRFGLAWRGLGLFALEHRCRQAGGPPLVQAPDGGAVALGVCCRAAALLLASDPGEAAARSSG